MTSSKPYLLRALNEWILSNSMTPHIVVDTTKTGVRAPVEHIVDGKIVLNISLNAVQGLEITNDIICFAATFSGTTKCIIVPMLAITSIYAKETGEGMVFKEGTKPTVYKERPTLTLVKTDK